MFVAVDRSDYEEKVEASISTAAQYVNSDR